MELTKTLLGTIVVVLLAGCSTSFVGTKLSQDGILPAKESKNGIPIMLPRPVFKLNITPDEADSTKAKFELSLKYVPDPSQTYSVRLDQAPFTETSMKFDFSENLPGVLSSVGATVKEQVNPTITSIAGFTASVVGLQTTATLDTATISSATLSAELDTTITEIPKPALFVLVSKIRPHCSVVGEQIAMDLQHFVPSPYRSEPNPDPESWRNAEVQIREQYYYRTPEQQACLEMVASTLAGAERAKIQEAKSRLFCSTKELPVSPEMKLMEYKGQQSAVHANYNDKPPSNLSSMEPAERKFCKAFDGALKAGELPTLIGLYQQAERGMRAAHKDHEERRKFETRMARLQQAIAIATRPIDGRTQEVRFLEFFAQMPEEMWRARHVLFLRTMRGVCIAESYQGAWRHCRPAEKLSDIAEIVGQIDEEIAQLASAKDHFDRLRELRKFLATVRDRGVQGGRAPAAAEYIAIRGEFDLLKQSLQGDIATLVGASGNAPGLTEPEDKVSYALPSQGNSSGLIPIKGRPNVAESEHFDVPIVPMSVVDQSQEAGWRPHGKPDFVIVVESLASEKGKLITGESQP